MMQKGAAQFYSYKKGKWEQLGADLIISETYADVSLSADGKRISFGTSVARSADGKMEVDIARISGG